MPIRKDLKHLYPKHWKQLSQQLKEQAGWCCQACGVPQYAIAYWQDGQYHLIKGSYYYDQLEYTSNYKTALAAKKHLSEWCDYPQKLIVVVLTTAHLDHDPTNNTPENLRVLCAHCHLKHDQAHHVESRIRNARCKETLDLFMQYNTNTRY